MTLRLGPLLLLAAFLAGCFPTYSAPIVIPVSDLAPPATSGITARNPIFMVVMDRFRDDRSDRSTLGRYDLMGKGGFAGTKTIVADRDITEVFEDLVKKSLHRKGIQQGPSPFIFRGVIKQVNVGASPDSKTIKATTFLELSIVNSKTGARIWQKSFMGSASGVDPKTTLALAIQDMSLAIEQDDTILGLREIFIASGGKLPETAGRPETIRKAVDIDEIPDFKASPLQNDLAVVIGIENYQDLPKSDYSKSDAGIVKDYLRALGFQERNIEFATDEKATKSKIETAIEGWLPNKVKKDSRVFVYYSGHGAPDPQAGEAYIVPYDGDPNYLSTSGYSLKRLYDNLSKLQASEIIVVLDSCFSGAGGRSVLAKGARPLVMMTTSTVLPTNIAVLSATQGTQISTSSPEKGHGIFTYYFLKALKDGKKNLVDIYEYIKPLVEDEAKQINVQQSPSISPETEKLRGRFTLRK